MQLRKKPCASSQHLVFVLHYCESVVFHDDDDDDDDDDDNRVQFLQLFEAIFPINTGLSRW